MNSYCYQQRSVLILLQVLLVLLLAQVSSVLIRYWVLSPLMVCICMYVRTVLLLLMYSTNEQSLLLAMVCTDTASGISTVAGTGKLCADQVLVLVLVMVCVCMYCTTTNNNVNADTRTACVTATDAMLVPLLDPKYQCTLIPTSVPVFEQ